MAASGQTVLIYVHDPADIKLISYCCRQMGYAVQQAPDPEAVTVALEETMPAIAFVDLELERLDLPPETGVITVGDSRHGAAYRVLHYQARCFLARPLSLSAVMLGLQKGAGLYGDGRSFITQAVNIATTLRTITHALRHIEREQGNRLSFKDSVATYCQQHCHNAKRQEELSDQDDGYEILAYFSDQGARYCNQIQGCSLRAFQDFAASSRPSLAATSPLDLLRTDFRTAEGDTLQAKVSAMTESYDLLISRLFAHKNEYCRHHCTKRREGLAFQAGDRLHVDSSELVQGVAVYCSEHHCPLDSFFEVFTRKVVQG